MFRREMDRGENRFENSPAYIMAKSIHDQNPQLEIRQTGIFPIANFPLERSLHLEFVYSNNPWYQEIFEEGLYDFIDIDHSISLGFRYGDYVEGRIKILVGTDGVVSHFEDTGKPAIEDMGEDSPNITKLNILSDKSIESLVNGLKNFENKTPDADFYELLFNPNNEPNILLHENPFEDLKNEIKRLSKKHRKVISHFELLNYSHEVTTEFENDSPISVTLNRSTIVDNNKINEKWGFSADKPPTFTIRETPKFSMTKSADLLSIENDLILISSSRIKEEEETGGNIAVNKDVEKGIRVLQFASKSKKKRFETPVFQNPGK